MAKRGDTSAPGVDIKVGDILASVQLLNTVSPETVQMNAGTFLRRKLYEGTGLDGDERLTHEGSRGLILRKNVYYLARITRNVTILTIQMTQKGILTLDEKDVILDTEANLPKAITFYRTLLEQDGSNFNLVIDIMKEHDNAHVAEILERNKVVTVPSTNAVARTPPKPTTRVVVPPGPAPVRAVPWHCPHCTFLNQAGSKDVCEVCSRSRRAPEAIFFEPEADDGGGFVTCDRCTYRSPSTSMSCGACASPLEKQIQVARDLYDPFRDNSTSSSSDDEDE